jgi:hypothetical protein
VQAGAVLGFLLAAVAMYTAFALLLEEARGREILLLGRQGAARAAAHGTLSAELRGTERDFNHPAVSSAIVGPRTMDQCARPSDDVLSHQDAGRLAFDPAGDQVDYQFRCAAVGPGHCLS